jgi:Mor family transcriptional regulator
MPDHPQLRNSERNVEIIKLHNEGNSYTRIARFFMLSTQRVQQICRNEMNQRIYENAKKEGEQIA